MTEETGQDHLRHPSVHWGRRRFLCAAAGAGIAFGIAPRALHADDGLPQAQPSSGFPADVELEMTARTGMAAILPGRETAVLRYEVALLKGAADTVTELPGTQLAPTLRFRTGQRVRVWLRNALSDESQIVHWHGLHVPESADGHPRYAVAPGGSYLYEFEVRNRAGTYFYHSHTDGLTGSQIYRGLIGLLLVQDEEERALGFPDGAQDLPVILQDRRFDAANQLIYLRHPMEAQFGFAGDQILVNGRRADVVRAVATLPYRLRLINLSNARIYKLAWQDGSPLTVIGTDGGLMKEPVTRPYLTLGPGERFDLWVDLRGRKLGTELALMARPVPVGMGGMGMMMEGMGSRGQGRMRGMAMMMDDMKEMDRSDGNGPDDGMEMDGGMRGGMRGRMRDDGSFSDRDRRSHGEGSALDRAVPVLRLRLEREEDSGRSLSARLVPFTRYREEDAANRGNPRLIALSFEHGRGFLNGRSFAMTEAVPEERIPLNTLQLIEFVNTQGHGMMMGPMPHPMHIHGQQFQIVRRETLPGHASAVAELAEGFVDEGLKDTVLVLPGQRVTLLKRFDEFAGLFLYHCHNLEHEDRGMMRNFNVRA